jgi:threonine/homoserine/homoserine lactone efflux protein
MAEAISAVLTYAVGVAISPTPIIAGILMLFSARARTNGPMFLTGWVLAIGVLCAVAYFLADAGDAATDETASDTISWGKLAVGVFFLLVAAKQWRSRPAPGVQSEMPKWMAGIDAFSPGKAFTLGLLVAGVNPKNLLLSLGAGAALAQAGPSTPEAVVSWVIFVVVGSLTIAGPVVYSLVGGETARATLDAMKQWLAVHNVAVMTVLFLFFGVKLVADALPAVAG